MAPTGIHKDSSMCSRSSRLRWIALTSAMWLLAGVLGGCSHTTETGYEPRSLNMSDGERRSLYAPAFTAGAHAGDSAAEDMAKARKPTP